MADKNELWCDYALMLGVPAIRKGCMSRHGHQLRFEGHTAITTCSESGWRYKEVEPERLICLDWPEDQVLPDQLQEEKDDR